jgi:16S rRNA (guanine527-N7)-methyltransferase
VSRDAGEKLRDGLTSIGISVRDDLANRLLSFAEAVLRANTTTNLVGAKSIAALVSAHLLDSLAILPIVRLESPIIDVGSGAGFPGIPIALALPGSSVVLFEPRKKRVDFLRQVIVDERLKNVTVEQVTAETAGRGARRGAAGTVLVRAVAQPRISLELGLPLLRKGGQLVLFRGRESTPDEGDLAIAKLLGGELTQAVPVTVPYLDGVRHVWVFRKTQLTPDGYPRRSGIPGKEPLQPE